MENISKLPDRFFLPLRGLYCWYSRPTCSSSSPNSDFRHYRLICPLLKSIWMESYPSVSRFFWLLLCLWDWCMICITIVFKFYGSSILLHEYIITCLFSLVDIWLISSFWLMNNNNKNSSEYFCTSFSVDICTNFLWV